MPIVANLSGMTVCLILCLIYDLYWLVTSCSFQLCIFFRPLLYLLGRISLFKNFKCFFFLNFFFDPGYSLDINFLFSTSVLEKLNWLAPMPSHAVFTLLLSRPDYDLVPAELENMCTLRCSLENLVDPPRPVSPMK